MLYLGEFQLGNSVPLFLRTTSALHVPTEPNDCPVCVIWKGSTEIERFELPVIERFTKTGSFFLSLFLGTDYSEGNYLAEFRYVLPDDYIGSKQSAFRIVAGGNADGSIVTMYFHARPEAKYVIQQVERGLVLPGKNPSI